MCLEKTAVEDTRSFSSRLSPDFTVSFCSFSLYSLKIKGDIGNKIIKKKSHSVEITAINGNLKTKMGRSLANPLKFLSLLSATFFAFQGMSPRKKKEGQILFAQNLYHKWLFQITESNEKEFFNQKYCSHSPPEMINV